MRISDWSSDVCSSDLIRRRAARRGGRSAAPYRLCRGRPCFGRAGRHAARHALRAGARALRPDNDILERGPTMRYPTKALTGTALALALAAPAALRAQDAEQSAGDEIVVTAQKRAQTLIDRKRTRL